MGDITWANIRVTLDELDPWPRNPRQIKGDQAKRLAQSYDDFGEVEPVAIGPKNERGKYPLYNGHQRYFVLQKEHGGKFEVNARVSSRPLTEKEREKLTVFLHRGATGSWDFDTLANEFDFGELLEWGFEEKELLGAGWYVAAPARPLHNVFGSVLKDRGIWRQTIQWIKNNSTFSPLGVCYHWRAEPIFFGWLPNGAHRWYGGRAQTTVWEIDRPTKSPEHPTMKPVELVMRAINNSSRAGEIIADPFCGSGTTIVACEQTDRRCRAVEISPAYVSVALERFYVMTGKMPELIEPGVQ